MHRFEERPIAIARCEAARTEPGRNLLEGVARFDLGMAPRRDVVRCARPYRCDFRSQALEPCAVHRLERQLVLEALGRSGLEIPGRLQGAIPLEAGAVTLKTERPSCVRSALVPADRA